MKVISKEEFYGLAAKSRRISNPIMREVDKIEVYQALVISKEEWPYKTPPSGYINQYNRATRNPKRFTVITLMAGGYAVLRVEDRNNLDALTNKRVAAMNKRVK